MVVEPDVARAEAGRSTAGACYDVLSGARVAPEQDVHRRSVKVVRSLARPKDEIRRHVGREDLFGRVAVEYGGPWWRLFAIGVVVTRIRRSERVRFASSCRLNRRHLSREVSDSRARTVADGPFDRNVALFGALSVHDEVDALRRVLGVPPGVLVGILVVYAREGIAAGTVATRARFVD